MKIFFTSTKMTLIEQQLEKTPTFIITKFKDPASDRAIKDLNNHGIPYKRLDLEEAEDLAKEVMGFN